MMRRLTHVLFGLDVVAFATPALADIEYCVPALEAEAAYLQTVEPANDAYGKVLAAANSAKFKALDEANTAERSRSRQADKQTSTQCVPQGQGNARCEAERS